MKAENYIYIKGKWAIVENKVTESAKGLNAVRVVFDHIGDGKCRSIS